MTPGHARPGDQVTVVGKKCTTDGKAGSLAFKNGSIDLNGAEEVDGRAGLATINWGTAPGTYSVQVICDGKKYVGQVVVDGNGHTDPKTHKTPAGGAKTGFGGGAGDGDLTLLAGGGVLMLGAAGAGAMALRRRNGSAA